MRCYSYTTAVVVLSAVMIGSGCRASRMAASPRTSEDHTSPEVVGRLASAESTCGGSARRVAGKGGWVDAELLSVEGSGDDLRGDRLHAGRYFDLGED